MVMCELPMPVIFTGAGSWSGGGTGFMSSMGGMAAPELIAPEPRAHDCAPAHDAPASATPIANKRASFMQQTISNPTGVWRLTARLRWHSNWAVQPIQIAIRLAAIGSERATESRT